MSLQEQLKDEQACIDHHEEKAGEAYKRRDEVLTKIKAEKPKLRHGDAGWDKTGNPCLALHHVNDPADDLRAVGHNCIHSVSVNAGGHNCIDTLAYNVIDDLKALQEDVTQFGVDFKRVFSGEGGGFGIRDKMTGHTIYISGRDSDEFLLKLRQMDATAKRNK